MEGAGEPYTSFEDNFTTRLTPTRISTPRTEYKRPFSTSGDLLAIPDVKLLDDDLLPETGNDHVDWLVTEVCDAVEAHLHSSLPDSIRTRVREYATEIFFGNPDLAQSISFPDKIDRLILVSTRSLLPEDGITVSLIKEGIRSVTKGLKTKFSKVKGLLPAIMV